MGLGLLCTVNMLIAVRHCVLTIHLLGMARPTMDIDHCTVIIVGVIIFFYTNHVSKLHVESNV